MIRTGYLRWEIEADDARSAADAAAREVTFRARPSYRVVRLKSVAPQAAAERFARGEASYEDVIRNQNRPAAEIDVTVPEGTEAVLRVAGRDEEVVSSGIHVRTSEGVTA